MKKVPDDTQKPVQLLICTECEIAHFVREDINDIFVVEDDGTCTNCGAGPVVVGTLAITHRLTGEGASDER